MLSSVRADGGIRLHVNRSSCAADVVEGSWRNVIATLPDGAVAIVGEAVAIFRCGAQHDARSTATTGKNLSAEKGIIERECDNALRRFEDAAPFSRDLISGSMAFPARVAFGTPSDISLR